MSHSERGCNFISVKVFFSLPMKGKARGILDDDDTFFLELQYVSVFRQRADNPPERQQTSFPKLKRAEE